MEALMKRITAAASALAALSVLSGTEERAMCYDDDARPPLPPGPA